MKVTTNKHGECHLRWQYDNKDKPLETKLFLEKNQDNIIKEVIVVKHHLDNNSKEAARKFSLDKLLKEEFDKEDRKNIWETYLNR